MASSQAHLSDSVVESWDTFMVPDEPQLPTPQSYAEPAALQCFYFGALADQFTPCELSLPHQHLSSSSDASPACDEKVQQPMKLSSHLWLLSLVSHNRELMCAVPRLFLQFNQQFAETIASHQLEVEQLQARQEKQLASLLNVDVDVSRDMIVNSSVTEHLVLQHQREVEDLLTACMAQERELEAELQRNFFDLLNTSAPDAIAALTAKTASLEEARQASNGSSFQGNCDSSLNLSDDWVDLGESKTVKARTSLQHKAEVNISRFASRPTTDAAKRKTGASISLTPTTNSVPVRTVVLENPNPPHRTLTRPKAGDAAARAIVVDVSPTSCLASCLASCCDLKSPTVTLAAEEHLMRLAHGKHAMLFLIGGVNAAKELIQSQPSPELLLGGRSRRDEIFVPLPGVPQLQVLFTTRFWAANVVLLWDPTASSVAVESRDRESPLAESSGIGPMVMESALRLAFSWNVDMFSVAVLSAGFGGSVAAVHSGMPADMSIHLSSLDVLRLLRDAMSIILLENAHSPIPQLWTVQDEALLSQQYWAETSTPSCPRAAGVQCVGLGGGGGERTSADVISILGNKPRQDKRALSHQRAGSNDAALNTDNNSTRRAGSLSAASLPASRPAPVYFNTPMAIRVFLPLPEHLFSPALAPHMKKPDRLASQSASPNTVTSGDPCRANQRAVGSFSRVSPTASPAQQPLFPSTSNSSRHARMGASLLPSALSDSDTVNSSFATESRDRQRVDLSGFVSIQDALKYAFGNGAVVY